MKICAYIEPTPPPAKPKMSKEDVYRAVQDLVTSSGCDRDEALRAARLALDDMDFCQSYAPERADRKV